MKRSIKPATLKSWTRKLHVTVSGRWYVALTILIGVVAIVTGNNAIYVMESLLLSGLILSGILSEQVISSADVEIKRGPAVAGSLLSNGDQVIIHNRSNRLLFCLEIGEWGEWKSAFVPLAWVSQLKPRATVTLTSRRVYAQRGTHRWTALAIATRYPFGFARKIRFKNQPGTRTVWPALPAHAKIPRSFEDRRLNPAAGSVLQQDEIRPMLLDDDYRSIVWTLSNKGSEPVVRARKAEKQSARVVLDVRGGPGPQFEEMVSSAAFTFYQAEDPLTCTLVILHQHGRKIWRGRLTILNQLAIVQAQGQAEGVGTKTSSAPITYGRSYAG